MEVNRREKRTLRLYQNLKRNWGKRIQKYVEKMKGAWKARA
jgi:hypothetical protein